MSSIDYNERLRITLVEQTQETRQRARLHVCSQARDAADARVLLEALGLVEPLVPSPAGRRVR